MYKQLLSDGHEIGNHHFNHIRADDYVEEFGLKKYFKNQILSMDSLFEHYKLPKTKSFVYSNHRRNEKTDSIIGLRYFNYRGVSDPDKTFQWKNERLLAGFRLDHHAEYPDFMHDLLLIKMPELIQSENVQLMWGHGITSKWDLINWYTSDRTLHLILSRGRELGLKFYTQSELYTLTKPLKTTFQSIIGSIAESKKFNAPCLEVKNVSAFPINLLGFYVRKNQEEKSSMQINRNIILMPGEIVNIIFSGRDTIISPKEVHTKLTVKDQDRIYLLWPDNSTVLDRQVIGNEAFAVQAPPNISINETVSIKIFGENDKVLNNNDFEWFSSNEDVLSIDEKGKITGQSRGSAMVASKSKFSGKLEFSGTIIIN